jgi:transposase
MSTVATIGLDLAKSVFQIHGVDDAGRAVLRRRLSRHELVSYFAELPTCLVAMEACSAAHHWARELSRLGHCVRLIPPQYVKPYVKRNKTDAADAEAICEAVGRPNMRFVPIKTMDQQGVLSLHRVRSLFVRQRTAAINTVRGLLTEFGIVAGKGIRRVAELRQRMDISRTGSSLGTETLKPASALPPRQGWDRRCFCCGSTLAPPARAASDAARTSARPIPRPFWH